MTITHTIEQTVDIPASRRITIDVPGEVPTGAAIITFTLAPKAAALHECPICAGNCDPVTGNPRYNAETVAAIKEGRAMMRGEIPAKRFSSLDEMWDDLIRDDLDEPSIDEPDYKACTVTFHRTGTHSDLDI